VIKLDELIRDLRRGMPTSHGFTIHDVAADEIDRLTPVQVAGKCTCTKADK
jgi:hypothetical protein